MATRNAEMQVQLDQFQALLNTLQGEVQDLRTRNNALNNDVVLLRQENQTLSQAHASILKGVGLPIARRDCLTIVCLTCVRRGPRMHLSIDFGDL
jgi:hypothetical protein